MEKVNDIIAAIDIGTTKIVAVLGKRTKENRFEIIGFGVSPSKGIRRGVVYNVEETINSIELAVKNASASFTHKINEVFVGIAGQHISSQKNRCRLVFENNNHIIEDIDLINISGIANKTLVEQGEEIIDVIPQSYIVDEELGIANPCGMKGAVLEANFHLVLGRMGMVNNIKQCVVKSGLSIKKLFLEPLASAAAVLSPIEKESGVVMLDIGGGTTDLVIYVKNKVIHTAVIPIGGNSITFDIQNYFSILEQQAEFLKLKHGSAIQEKSSEQIAVRVKGLKGREDKEIQVNELSRVVQAKMEEILHAVMFQIETAGVRNKLPGGMVITGGGALLKNLKHLATLITKNDVRIAYPSESVVGDFADQINRPQYSTAVGLLLLGYKYNIQQLEDEEIVEAFNIRRIHKEKQESEVESKQSKEKSNERSFFTRVKNSVINLLDED